VLAVPSPAAANGRFPAANQIVFSPSDPNLVFLRTTFGILRSTDGGLTWAWLCEDMLGLGPASSEDPSLALTETGTLVAGLSLGLKVSADQGCDWTTIGGELTGQHIEDLDVRPNAPDRVLAITSTYERDAGVDGGSGYLQQIYESTDDGATWAVIGAIDPSATVQTIEAAASDPQRIYVSAFRGFTQRTTSLFVSTDGAKTWTERPTPFDPSTETAVYIAAVDPQNADRIYVRSNGNAGRLMVTSDAGMTFQIALELGDQMEGFALSPDGSKVYVGGPNRGLYMASTADLMFQPIGKPLADGTRGPHVQCLATHGADLWACSDEPSGFIAGVSQDDGATFAPRLHLATIAGVASCPAGATSTMCTSFDYDASPPYDPFLALCTNLGTCEFGDASYPLSGACAEAGACSTSVADAGTTGDAGDAPAGLAQSSCHCSAVAGGGAGGALSTAVAALAIARRRRRR
jgi:photosystem II stability/assembly factor-like uncharacterized protein